MNSGVNKCITMRLLKNILHFILIININKALKLTLSNKQILLLKHHECLSLEN